jgi:hypothetical protein
MNRVVAIAMAFSLGLQGPAALAVPGDFEGKYEKTKTPIKHLVVIFDEKNRVFPPDPFNSSPYPHPAVPSHLRLTMLEALCKYPGR